MRYCPPNVTLSDVWVNHGFSICFYETVTSGVLAAFALVFGCLQFRMYRRYATRHERVNLPRNWLFTVQLCLHALLLVLALLNLLARHTVAGAPPVYGYEVLAALANAATWPLLAALVLVERHFQLPSAPAHGHGAVLLLAWTTAFIFENLDFLSLNNRDWFFDLSSMRDKVEFGFFICRYLFTLGVFGIGIKAPGISQTRDYLIQQDEEAMLADQEQHQRRSASEGSTWSNLFAKLAKLLPYMWPKKSAALQLRVLACLILLAGVRVANVFVPIFSKKIVDALTPAATADGPIVFPWDLITAFVGIKLLQGGGTGGQGLLNNMRTFLWIRVQQYTTREIQVGLFSHLHALSLRWHLTRKTGEVLRVMDRGTTSINGLLSYLVFNILPTIVDIVVAVAYFTVTFNVWFGLIVFVTMALYLAMTVAITEWRTKYRRSMNLADNDQRTKGVDSLLNFETVKYYNAEQYEIGRYEKAILNYQDEEWKSLSSLTFLNTAQSLLINAGLLVGSLYCGYLVAVERVLTVGDYVLFGTYILQLMVPLNFLGTLYRVIQESFINMENMLDLLDEREEVTDSADAIHLMPEGGHIEFKDVNFSYVPERPILKNISFVAQPGQKIALVGPTGSGKSTIIRLLFRFYDVQSGAVTVDGRDVRGVTQESLRRMIGVVPQDTVLFNDTIAYNIRYGRPEADAASVEAAAAHADIHHRILGFPEGYDTKVGERGLKLSGGEKQRVAIARTLLKSPAIVLLDEATSALDTQTERNIQEALESVCKDRTTLIVAHRLSTVTSADAILVLRDGEIVERGRHDELLRQEGVYYSMWNQQSQAKESTAETSATVEESKD